MIRFFSGALAAVILMSLGFYARGITQQPQIENVRYDDGFERLLQETTKNINLPVKGGKL